MFDPTGARAVRDRADGGPVDRRIHGRPFALVLGWGEQQTKGTLVREVSAAMIIYVSGSSPISFTLKELTEIFQEEAKRICGKSGLSRMLAMEAMRDFVLAHGPRRERDRSLLL